MTARFVKEVLRIWSSPPVVTRPVRTDLSLDGIKLCPGQQYTISAYMLHHDDRDWHDPEPVSYTHLDVYKRQLVVEPHATQPTIAAAMAPPPFRLCRRPQAPACLLYTSRCV